MLCANQPTGETSYNWVMLSWCPDRVLPDWGGLGTGDKEPRPEGVEPEPGDVASDAEGDAGEDSGEAARGVMDPEAVELEIDGDFLTMSGVSFERERDTVGVAGKGYPSSGESRMVMVRNRSWIVR